MEFGDKNKKWQEKHIGEGSGTQKNLSFDRQSKKMNLYSWSLGIKIKNGGGERTGETKMRENGKMLGIQVQIGRAHV